MYEFPYEYDGLKWEALVGEWANQKGVEVVSVAFDYRWGYRSVIVKVKPKKEAAIKDTETV